MSKLIVVLVIVLLLGVSVASAGSPGPYANSYPWYYPLTWRMPAPSSVPQGASGYYNPNDPVCGGFPGMLLELFQNPNYTTYRCVAPPQPAW